MDSECECGLPMSLGALMCATCIIEKKEFMSHPNLSPEINRNLAQSKKDGGIFLKDLPENCMVEVQTRNTLYQIKRDPNNGNFMLIKGHAKFCPDWTSCRIAGSTWGGSMLKMGFIGVGMRLEVNLFNASKDEQYHATMTTSEIKEVWVK